MPRPRKNREPVEAAVPTRQKRPTVLSTTDEAELAALVSRAKAGTYDLEKIGRLTARDVYENPWPYNPPAYFDRKRASCIFRAWYGLHRAALQRIIDPTDPFHYTVCTRANAREWAVDGEAPDEVFATNGGVIIREQLMLYRPIEVTRKEHALKAERSRPKKASVMGKDKDGTEPEKGVQVYYREGEGAFQSGRDTIVAERSDVPAGAGIGLDEAPAEEAA
jgi:hypothetical protein